MPGNHKIHAKQIDIQSVETALDELFLKKNEIVTDVEEVVPEVYELPVATKVVAAVIEQKADCEHKHSVSDIVDLNVSIDVIDGGEI